MQAYGSQSRQAALASLTPVAPPPESVVPDADDPASAAALLERGFTYFREDMAAQASAAFRGAIATGHLNDAGRALAYWHIYLAERGQGNIEAGADALASFVVVGQDVLDVRNSMRYAVDDSGDFVDRFDLERRMSRARALLSATWAGKVSDFGRSPEHPVLVRDENELKYFLELAPTCQREPDRTIVRAAEQQDSAERVTISCEENHDGAEYYIQGQ